MANPWERDWGGTTSSDQDGAPAQGGPWNRDWDSGAPEPKPTDEGDFHRGWDVAWGQLKPLAQGATGLVGATMEKTLGAGGVSTSIKNWGLNGYQTGMQALQPLQKDTDELTTAWKKAKEGDWGALVDWAQYGIGYNLGQLSQAATTAAAGAVIGTVATAGNPAGTAAGAIGGAVEQGATRALAARVLEPLVQREIAKIAAEQAAKNLSEQAVRSLAVKAVARDIGALGAVAAYTGVQEAGSIYPDAEAEAKKQGRELDGADLARVWAGTAGATAIESLTDTLGLGAITGRIRVPGVGGRVARAATGAAIGSAAGGATEAAQTVLERWGAGQEIGSPEGIKDIINSAGLGALGDAGPGAIGGALHGPAQTPAPAPVQPQVGDLRTAVDQYLQNTGPRAEDVVAAIGKAATVDEAISVASQATDSLSDIAERKQGAYLAPLMDRQADLARQAATAPTEFERTMAADQAATSLAQNLPGRPASDYVNLHPMDERTANGALRAEREMTANAGGNALELEVVPHPSIPGKFAIARTAQVPSLDLPGPSATEQRSAEVAQQGAAQNKIESAALAGTQTARVSTPEEQGRQALITRTMQAIEQRGGVASPEEARTLQEAGLGQPYDRVDPALSTRQAALTTDQKLTQATGIALDKAPRPRAEAQTGRTELAQATTENNARSDSRMQRLAAEREAAQNAKDAANLATQQQASERPAPNVDALTSILKKSPALRNAQEQTILNDARQTLTPEQFSIIERAAVNPPSLSATERLQLRRMREGDIKFSAPREAAPESEKRGDTESKGEALPYRHEDSKLEEGAGSMEPRQHELVRQLARIFGKKIQVFSSEREDAPDGYVRKGDDRTIYLNSKSQQSHLVVFGHELLHQLKRNNPAAYETLAKVIKLKEGVDISKVSGIEGDMEEFTADLMGNRFAEPQFWIEVFNQLQDKPAAVKLGETISRVVKQFINVLKGMRGFETDQMVANLEEIRNAARDALAQYARSQYKEAQQLDQETRNASRQEPQQRSVQNERQEGDRSGQAAEAGSGNRVQRAAPSEETSNAQRQSVKVEVKPDRTERRRQAVEAARREMQDPSTRRHGPVPAEPDAKFSTKRSTMQDRTGADYDVSVAEQAFGVNATKPNSILVEARQDGQRRGFIDFSIRDDGVLTSENTKVAPASRGKGVAEMMYRAARNAGYDIAPGRVQTDLGLKMVEGLQRSGLINKEAIGPRFRAGDLDLVPSARRDDLFPGDFASKRTTVPTGRVISSTGETARGSNVNSAGNRIAATKQGLENFWKWFGNSETVDDKGRPEVYYHTTRNDFNKFEANRVTKNSGTFGEWETSRAAMFFTDSVKDSEAYGTQDGKFREGTRVMPVYLRAENVLDLTPGYLPEYGRDAARIEEAGLSKRYFDRFDWSKFDDAEGREMVDGLRKAGYDAVRFWDQNPDTEGSFKALAVFDPEQIKSAIGNRETFDSRDADITKSAKRGQLDNVEAYHYSQQPRTRLDSSYFGTGLKGSAREEYLNAEDPRRRQRISFYFDKGTGVRPESGVGGVPHRATLNNIYDSNADPLGLRKGGQAAFESAVLDNGFDGYLDRLEGTQPGQVILLGKRSIPVEALKPGPIKSGQKVEPLERTEPKWETQASGPVAAMEAKADRMRGQPAWKDYDVRVTPGTGGFATVETRAKQASPATLNVGLSTAEVEGSGQITPQRVRQALEDLGVPIEKLTVHESDTEPTAVVELGRALTPMEANHLSVELKQEAIAQRNADGTGELFGPKAQEWGPYNPSYFLMPDGKRAEEIAASAKRRQTMTNDELAQLEPRMKVRNKAEFQQRLQWLSEGMLRNHLESVEYYRPDPKEIALYRRFRGLDDVTASAKRERTELNPEIVQTLGKHIRNLTPEERAKLRRDTAARLVDTIKQLPSSKEMAAVAYAGRAKRGWYYNSAKAIEHVFGGDGPRFAALLAALSPRCSVETNLLNALNTYKNWVAAGRPTTREEIIDVMAQSVQGGHGRASVLDAWINNSVRALSAEDPSKITLSGPKVNSFMKNLVGVTEEVTNDAWMSNYALVDQTIFSGSLTKGGDPGKGVGYLAMSARVREAAKKLTQLTGEEWTPAEVQETIWSWAKALYETASVNKSAEEIVLDKGITDEMLRSTPDFRTLFHDDVNEQLLREAGLGDRVATLRERSDLGYASDEESGAQGQAAPFDSATQEGYEVRAARRLDELRRRGLSREDDVTASAKRIFDDQGRDYTPEQRAAFERVGRVVEVPTLKERIQELKKDLAKKMAQGLVDQFRPLRELGDKAYNLARLSRGSSGAVEAFLKHGKLKIVDGVYDADRSGGVIERLFAPLQGEGTDFLWWVAANRAERLSAEERENLFQGADIAALKSLESGTTSFDYTLQDGRVTRDRTLIYRDALKVLNEFNKNAMDMAEQSGLIDGEARKIWEHEFYVPFYRQSEEGGGGFVGVKSGLVRQQAFKSLKGGTDQLRSDLLSNALLNWSHLIDAAAKNRAAAASVEAAVKLGIATEVENGTKGAVWVMDRGEKKSYLVDDPYVMTAISSLEYAGLKGGLWDTLTTFKHWLTVGVTASPAFKIRNLVRDSVQAVSVAPMGYNPVANIARGIRESNPETQTYVSALASGGLIRFGTMLEGREADRVRQLVKVGVKDSTVLDSESKMRAFYDKVVEPTISAYNELGNRGEEINRAALFAQLREQGVPLDEAALQARDLMDFSMQGTWQWVRVLTQVVPFMNARLQGLYKMGRGAAEDPKRFAVVLGSVALASIALMAAYQDDDDWKKREDWDRNNFWWFKVGGVAWRIPKPFEIGAIATLAERGLEMFINKDMTLARYGRNIRDLLLDNLSMNPIPQAVKPILDVYSNKDSFTGRPIESMGTERLQPDYRFTASTSMAARAASTAGQAVTSSIGVNFLSPVQIDHMLRGYFGWLGSFVVGGADMAVRPLTSEPTRPAADYWKLATQGIAAETTSGSSYYVSALYDQAKVLEEAYGTWTALIKQGKVAEAREFYEGNKDRINRYKVVERVKSEEAKYNELIRMIERSNIDPEVKKARIIEIRAKQDKLARIVTEAR